MSESTYWKETPCEHGFIEKHISLVGLTTGGVSQWEELCPGGLRIELHPTQPDYEAAFQHLGVDNGSLVRSAVDAANEDLVLLNEKE